VTDAAATARPEVRDGFPLNDDLAAISTLPAQRPSKGAMRSHDNSHRIANPGRILGLHRQGLLIHALRSIIPTGLFVASNVTCSPRGGQHFADLSAETDPE